MQQPLASRFRLFMYIILNMLTIDNEHYIELITKTTCQNRGFSHTIPTQL